VKKYWPLAVLILIGALAALALTPQLEMRRWMHHFMGFFLCQFAMLKTFNPSQFVEGFRKYDLLASRCSWYGYLYPWIELGLGLGYLSFFVPKIVYSLTIIVLGIGAVGVVQALRRGLDVRCACMGTVLNVPLSTVTLAEDLLMVLMATLLFL
jgi:hypothetical protein